ncbi:uncharacterized protein [Montipora capricornis]|uniref:uncharacterized protein n=1 Tax=Montipora capricornis TaxID=246305 RepID=UPI0035F1AFC2
MVVENTMMDRRAVSLLSFVLPCICAVAMAHEEKMPAPFVKVLYLKDPLMEGNDVVILQNLLVRSKFVTSLERTGFYDKKTSEAVSSYQLGNFLKDTGVFDATTASLVLDQLMSDGYKDKGTVPFGYKFKVHIPVYKDRTIETYGTLYDSNNVEMYTFVARCHGSINNLTGKAINQLTRNGNTPTGLITFDRNSKEPIPKLYGPYPVLRAVKGQEGNAAIGRNKNDTFLSDYRSGILLHTGEWDNWNASKPMPNSLGCIHVHPSALKKINELLDKMGVVIHKNPFGKKPYPYTPQGILSVEQID